MSLSLGVSNTIGQKELDVIGLVYYVTKLLGCKYNIRKCLLLIIMVG